MKRELVDQLWVNYRKAYTAKIRLKHSLQADNEINETLDDARQKFLAQVQQGVLPAPLDILPEWTEVGDVA